MNKAFLIGNLTKDWDLRTTQSGKTVATNSIATNKSYKDQSGQTQTITTFHNLVIWGNGAIALQKYTHKGSKLSIVGEINNEDYTGKDGVKRYITKINISEFEFLTPSVKTTSQDDYAQPEQQPKEDEINVENIPF